MLALAKTNAFTSNFKCQALFMHTSPYVQTPLRNTKSLKKKMQNQRWRCHVKLRPCDKKHEERGCGRTVPIGLTTVPTSGHFLWPPSSICYQHFPRKKWDAQMCNYVAFLPSQITMGQNEITKLTSLFIPM